MDARTRLREWMARSKLNQRAAARVLGMHYTFLSQILNRRRAPALLTAVRIERVTGIPAEAWVPTADGMRVKAVSARGRKSRVGKV